MKLRRMLVVLLVGLCTATASYGNSKNVSGKKKLIVVDSYHKEYLWSQYTNEGFCEAMLNLGYFDNRDQMTEYFQNDYVETSKAVVKKLWMDTKRKRSKKEKTNSTLKLTKTIHDFQPDLIFLGEDNATDYIGNQFLNSGVPIVFWGVNNTPLKYDLVESFDKPGHNVTGVYQTTYYIESLELLKRIAPNVKTFAVLSDATTTGRIFTKSILHLARKGLLPLKLVETVSTNSFKDWKKKALALQDKVDAFFVAQYAGLKDEYGESVSDHETAAWYIKHIKIPEAAGFKHRVVDGMLCAADDSGYNQGYEAVVIAHDILAKGADPATYPPRTPKRGPLMANKQRAEMLSITLTKKMGIEVYIEEASALKGANNNEKATGKKKIMVVSSYHKGYIWSRDTHKGFCAAMLKFGYLDNEWQKAEFTKNDSVESSMAVVKKLWMDTKRKSNKGEIKAVSTQIYKSIKEFNPDLIFLGDDNAARHIGNQFIDYEIPMVFWGLNNSPLKYGLVESMEKPGHNVTGVYQTGYYLESLELLKKISPSIKTFAVLADSTSTGRAQYKAIQYLDRKGVLPFGLVEIVATNEFDVWKKKALELQKKVDAFYVAQYSGLKDNAGNPVPNKEVADWYTEHIKIPEATLGTRVAHGLLCSAKDSGFNQGYEAVAIAHDILARGAAPATYPPRTPERGPLLVNKKRAEALGIMLTEDMKIERLIE